MILQGKFEAKKHAIRQTQDGWVVSFVVHPDDMSPEFAAAPLGTQIILAYSEYTEEAAEAFNPANVSAPVPPRPKRSEYDRRPFHTLSRAQQAGIKCSDAEFQGWLLDLDTPHALIGPLLDGPSAELAAAIVRHHCRVKTRGFFDTDANAGARWDAFLARYDESCGRIAERR